MPDTSGFVSASAGSRQQLAIVGSILTHPANPDVSLRLNCFEAILKRLSWHKGK